MKYLITGSSGQLAKAFIAHFAQNEIEFLAPDERSFDITSLDAVNAVIASYEPDVILNCAAYNNVDGAETDPAPAMLVNATAVDILTKAAEKYGATLVHYSSDYVFDGMSECAYTEDSPTSPLNEYGKSKLAGESALSNSSAKSLLLRLSWVYGDGSQNFLHKMLQWTEGRNSLKVVWDQLSVPTYTEDIVTYTLAALKQGLQGCYHLTNSGYASRYEVARVFFRCMQKDITIIPVGSETFPSPAKRPFFSVMSNKKLQSALHLEIPTWENALERFTAKLRA